MARDHFQSKTGAVCAASNQTINVNHDPGWYPGISPLVGLISTVVESSWFLFRNLLLLLLFARILLLSTLQIELAVVNAQAEK